MPKMRAEYAENAVFNTLLNALMPENRRALALSLCTGLRIGDVLNIRTERLRPRMTVRELKTGKNRRITIPKNLYAELSVSKGKYWLFEGRLDSKKHRTRAAVFKDLQRCAKLYRINGKKIKEHLSPHSARKIYAVEAYRKSGGDLKKVQKLLNHENEAVTMLYAMADILTQKNHR